MRERVPGVHSHQPYPIWAWVPQEFAEAFCTLACLVGRVPWLIRNRVLRPKDLEDPYRAMTSGEGEGAFYASIPSPEFLKGAPLLEEAFPGVRTGGVMARPYLQASSWAKRDAVG